MMLNRFLQTKVDAAGAGRKPQKRPYLASECGTLNEADKWRQQIQREIGRKVEEIQNAALGEHRLRDLNDEINKLFREKHHWEKRIVELGGPDYTKMGRAVGKEEEGLIRPGDGQRRGYRYFGAAKNLPGVKELFDRQAPKGPRKTRHQLTRLIDADYYGFRDEEDGVLLAVEPEAEAAMQAKAHAEWQAERAEQDAARAAMGGAAASGEGHAGIGSEYVAHVPLPEKSVIEGMVLDKKKRELLAKYASAALVAEEVEAKELLNKRQRTS